MIQFSRFGNAIHQRTCCSTIRGIMKPSARFSSVRPSLVIFVTTLSFPANSFPAKYILLSTEKNKKAIYIFTVNDFSQKCEGTFPLFCYLDFISFCFRSLEVHEICYL